MTAFCGRVDSQRGVSRPSKFCRVRLRIRGIPDGGTKCRMESVRRSQCSCSGSRQAPHDSSPHFNHRPSGRSLSSRSRHAHAGAHRGAAQADDPGARKADPAAHRGRNARRRRGAHPDRRRLPRGRGDGLLRRRDRASGCGWNTLPRRCRTAQGAWWSSRGTSPARSLSSFLTAIS